MFPAYTAEKPTRFATRRLGRFSVLLAFSFTFLVLLWQTGSFVYLFIYDRTPLPKIPELPQTSILYAADGSLLARLHGPFDRIEVPLSAIPDHLEAAVIAAEDENFYEEGAISPAAILRAAVANVRSRSFQQGGSTITQQVVKNRITGNERSLVRKAREAVLAQKLASRYSKDEIFAGYLNNVYFGEGAYGVQAAAQRYFSIDARDLSVAQAATLAGLIPAPELFDPLDHPRRAVIRRDLVLARMAELGFIEPSLATRLKTKKLKVNPVDDVPDGGSRYFVEHVIAHLKERYGDDAPFEGGLRVRTTLEPSLQKVADRAVRTNLDERGDPAAALVAIDPSSGAIVALSGSERFDRMQFNLATQARRQTGSAFKVFTLAAALENGISLDSIWSGPSSMSIADPRCLGAGGRAWTVGNYGDASAGTMSLLDATANSVNTIFAQVAVRVGPDKVADVARRMGIRSELQAVCSITLGSQSSSPLEMTSAFATLAAGGTYREALPVRLVLSPASELLFMGPPQAKRALDPVHADLVTRALQRVVTSGTGTAATLKGRAVAGKTGTAQNYQDAWFCGYTPQLATCVWVGYPKGPIPMLNVQGVPQVYGGSIPAAIWHDFMKAALADEPIQRFREGEASAPASGDASVGAPGVSPEPSPTEDAHKEPSPGPPPSEAPAPQPSEEPLPVPLPSPNGREAIGPTAGAFWRDQPVRSRSSSGGG